MSADPDPEYLTMKQVAARLGVLERTVQMYRYWRILPEPDLILLRHPLWMPETIDRWRTSPTKRKWMKKRGLVRKSPTPTTTPPKKAKLSSLGAQSDFRPVAGVNEDQAKEVAAALRGEGHHCTAGDVAELAVCDPASLDYDRRKLQQRVMRKLRGLHDRT